MGAEGIALGEGNGDLLGQLRCDTALLVDPCELAELALWVIAQLTLLELQISLL